MTPTSWGYGLANPVKVTRGGLVLRAFGRFLGVALAISSAGFWVMQSAPAMDDAVLLAMRIGLTCLFIGLGGLLYLFGQGPDVESTQVDLNERVLRRGRIVSDNAFETDISVPFGDVTGLLLACGKSSGGLGSTRQATLYLRLDDGAENLTAVEILSGPELLLRPIQDRLLRDLKDDRGGMAIPSYESHRSTKVAFGAGGRALQAA
ncbi:hypothetical protein [Aliiroseovarius sp. PrR006]|uniref:hypothetical protein n=1 Tax=Aliiroseovarius sp. PrR006 TaxID=2706883 RepID=UPI0013D1D198|nr:hypothetical protein [Aliiroseovarius sp. PrR006]NDW51956.1 hypothetical protein [Aliiroseovarius sp. PrR006]